jgi:hypothetical protein
MHCIIGTCIGRKGLREAIRLSPREPNDLGLERVGVAIMMTSNSTILPLVEVSVKSGEGQNPMDGSFSGA